MSGLQKSVAAGGHPAAVDAALSTIARGGNAFDAVVAAGFASTVVEPALTSLGGGGFLLARTAEGTSKVFDFFVDTPGINAANTDQLDFAPIDIPWGAHDQRFYVGLASVGVPGTLAGLLHVHATHARLPLAEVVEPARRLASEGLELNTDQAHVLEILHPIMLRTRASRELFERDGAIIQPGDHFSNPGLARFLERLAHEPTHTLYREPIADIIHEQMKEHAGLLTRDDLERYKVHERDPFSTTYRDKVILSNPSPSPGGELIARLLAELETHELSSVEWGSPDHAIRLAHAVRNLDERMPGVDAPTFNRGTTHFSVADAEGNLAAMTTSNGEGSGYVVPDVGIMLNNMMGEEDLHPHGFHSHPPGTRLGSMMAPTIVLSDGQPALVIGSGGSKRIRTAIPQVLSNVIDFGMDISTAVSSPRMHWEDDKLQFEPGFSEATINALAKEFPINPWPRKSFYFGGVHAVIPGQEGAGDSRRGGNTDSI